MGRDDDGDNTRLLRIEGNSMKREREQKKEMGRTLRPGNNGRRGVSLLGRISK